MALALAEISEGDLLDEVDALRRTQLETGVQLLRLVAEFAQVLLAMGDTLHHRIKTHGHWQVKQPFPGLYVWRDPYGATYLVDHTGTRRIPRSAPNTRSWLEERLIDLALAS